jgi:hypothetical protein
MPLEGWDHIPRGYGAEFYMGDAPWWLRFWVKTPFIDRYSYPQVVARGHALLIPHRDHTRDAVEVPGPGWRVRPVGYEPPGSTYGLRARD